ncbi:MAG: AraC family transcriptional regulator [Pleurocapsa minor HA4230-MV1]|jgi:AraC family transcriptional regulator|nr:AraC family transcriptional regulator [Pleurocapsa minor HA4230-MV1]
MSTNISTPSLLTSSDRANWTGVSLEHYLYPAYETPEHTLNEHHICLYVGKPLIYEQVVNGKLRSLNCIYGDMVIYPAGLTQKLSWNKNAEIIQLDINPALLTQACQDAPRSHKLELIPQYGIRDNLVQQLLFTLLGELQSGSNNSLYTESLHNTLCLHLLKHYTTFQTEINYSDDPLPPYLHRRLDEYIQANLAENITLADMAQVTSLSISHLTKLFRQTQGISLYQYVIHCRIARAKQLLKHQQLTIAEIATQVGFADQSHLTHHFKRHVGVTPKAFRL